MAAEFRSNCCRRGTVPGLCPRSSAAIAIFSATFFSAPRGARFDVPRLGAADGADPSLLMDKEARLEDDDTCCREIVNEGLRFWVELTLSTASEFLDITCE